MDDGEPDPLTDPCRCNQPDHAREHAHQRGGPFCRDTHDPLDPETDPA